MGFGSASFGSKAFGSCNAATTPAEFPQWVYEIDRIEDLEVSSPYISFFDITSSSGNVEYIVDWGHFSVRSSGNDISFDGEAYTPLHINRGDTDENIEGGSPRITISVIDWDLSVLSFVTDNDGLNDATVRMRIIQFKNIDSPSLVVVDRTFRVESVEVSENPTTITVRLESPSLFDFQFPPIYTNRLRCPHAWQNRFEHDGYNYCSYPSDDFMGATEQTFTSTTDSVVERDYGWWAMNGYTDIDYARSYEIAALPWVVTGDPRHVYVCGAQNVSTSNMRWYDSTRAGLYIFKVLPAGQDFDVHGKFGIWEQSYTNKCGILVQSSGSPSYWFFWGLEGKAPGYGGASGKYAKTVSDVTTEVAKSTGDDNVFRLKFNALSGVMYMYAMEQDTDAVWYATSANDSWTSYGNVGMAMQSTDYRVGILTSSTSSGVATMGCQAAYFRFFDGGELTCDRSYEACVNRSNLHQFGGFLGMPDGFVRH